MTSFTPNNIKIDAKVNTQCLLVLSEAYYPIGWRAYVDGKETEIYRADYSFRAIVVPEGEHKVIFSYQPRSFRLGLLISLGSLVGVFVLSSFWRKKKK